MDQQVKAHLDDIIKKIQKRKATLFIGAGCSVSAGAPTTMDLIKRLENKFSGVKGGQSDLLKLGEEIVNTIPYTPEDLTNYVNIQLETLEPSKYHITLTKYDWTAIFTTNYDDLLERAYLSPIRGKRARVFYGNETDMHFSERDRIHIFKLMGTVNREDPNTQPVLTTGDYFSSVKEKSKIYDVLIDIVKDGTLIFIGYSLDDYLALQALDAASGTKGYEKLPYSYLISPTDYGQTDPIKFTRRKIIPLNLKFEEFIDYLEENQDNFGKVPTEDISSKPNKTVLVPNSTLPMEIDNALVDEVEKFGELLTQEKIQSETGDMNEFFRGKNLGWGAFKKNWDFKREIYFDLKRETSNNIRKERPENNNFLLISGPPGCGKSMMLRRLAYDLALEGDSVVFWCDPNSYYIDLKALDSLSIGMNRKYDELIPQNSKKDRLKLVIIMDDAGTSQLNPNSIKNYLTSRGRLCLVIGATRESDWQWSNSFDSREIPEKNTFKISDEPTTSEKMDISTHLTNLGFESGNLFTMPNEDIDKSFFAIIYSAVNPARLPLNLAIRDQYQKLDNIEKKVFSNISLFNQFGLNINQELLVRSLNIGYVEFFKDVWTNRLSEIVLERTDIFDNTSYSTLHRIIAQRTISMFYPTDKQIYDVYLELLSSVNLTIDLEREYVERLLVNFLGAKKQGSRLTLEQKESLFETVCSKYHSKTLLHHLAIIKHELEKYEEAEHLLLEAISGKNDYGAVATQRESDRNIYVSLGSLYSDWALKLMENGDSDKGVHYLKQAEHYFENARYMGMPNAYPYHAHANMFISVAERQSLIELKLENYGNALEIISLAEHNLNKEDLLPILSLKHKIFSRLGKYDELIHLSEKIASEYSSASGFSLTVTVLLEGWEKEKDFNKKDDLAYRILAILSDSLDKFPKDEALLRMNANVTLRFFPHDRSKKISELLKWFQIRSHNDLTLMFQLAYLLFEEDKYDESDRIFRDLSKISQGLANRYNATEFYRDNDGKKKIFEGTISSIESEYRGWISIHGIKNPIFFRPITSPFEPREEDFVRLNISFSFRGPRAEVLRRD